MKFHSCSNLGVIKARISERKDLYPDSFILLPNSKSSWFRRLFLVSQNHLHYPITWISPTCICISWKFVSSNHPGKKSKYASRVVLQDASLSWEWPSTSFVIFKVSHKCHAYLQKQNYRKLWTSKDGVHGQDTVICLPQLSCFYGYYSIATVPSSNHVSSNF